MMAKYGWIFISSQQTLAGVSHSRPAIQTKKNVPLNLARRISTILENQQQKLRQQSELNENLKNMTTLSI